MTTATSKKSTSSFELLTPDQSALLIHHQPQMAFGVTSHERTSVLHNARALARAARLFSVPTILSTVAAKTFSLDFAPFAREAPWERRDKSTEPLGFSARRARLRSG